MEANQTYTDEPIKIRLTGDSRSKLHTREVEVCLADDEPGADALARTTERQKTNLVVKSEKEAQALLRSLTMLKRRDPDQTVWMTHNHKNAFRRVVGELKSEMDKRDWGQ